MLTRPSPPAAVFKWALRWAGTGKSDDGANALALGSSGSLYVVGYGTAKGSVGQSVAMRIKR